MRHCIRTTRVVRCERFILELESFRDSLPKGEARDKLVKSLDWLHAAYGELVEDLKMNPEDTGG